MPGPREPHIHAEGSVLPMELEDELELHLREVGEAVVAHSPLQRRAFPDGLALGQCAEPPLKRGASTCAGDQRHHRDNGSQRRREQESDTDAGSDLKARLAARSDGLISGTYRSSSNAITKLSLDGTALPIIVCNAARPIPSNLKKSGKNCSRAAS